MSKLAHVLAMMVLVAFAAGTSMQTAASAEMSMMTMDGEGSAGCKDCPDDDAQIGTCDQACTIAQAALGSRHGIDRPEVAGITTALPPTVLAGYIGPPDPDPPRTIILS